MHKVGNKIECNNMQGERIKIDTEKIQMVGFFFERSVVFYDFTDVTAR